MWWSNRMHLELLLSTLYREQFIHSREAFVARNFNSNYLSMHRPWRWLFIRIINKQQLYIQRNKFLVISVTEYQANHIAHTTQHTHTSHTSRIILRLRLCQFFRSSFIERKQIVKVSVRSLTNAHSFIILINILAFECNYVVRWTAI